MTDNLFNCHTKFSKVFMNYGERALRQEVSKVVRSSNSTDVLEACLSWIEQDIKATNTIKSIYSKLSKIRNSK